MGKLENKVAVVTGGTSGIGLAAARLFSAEGAKVTVTGSSDRSLDVARSELRGVAEVVASDAGASADVQKLAQSFKDGVDVLFLNAGIGRLGSIATLDEAAFDESFRINVRGPWLMLKYFGPLLRRGGTVVVTSSINNQIGMLGTSAYGATKAAVRSLVRVAANELAPQGIRVNAVSPGPIGTPFHDKLGLTRAEKESFAADLIKQIPLGRFGTPAEVAKAALFLASEDSSFMTGEEIVLDGGLTTV